MDDRRIGGVLRVALIGQRRGNSRDADLAVAAAEVLTLSLFARGGRMLQLHFSLLGVFFVFLDTWRNLFTLVGEWGGNWRQIVRYRDICRRSVAAAPYGNDW